MLFDALCCEVIDLPSTIRLATIGFSKYPENTILELAWFSPGHISMPNLLIRKTQCHRSFIS
jgi:hypothetical protein